MSIISTAINEIKYRIPQEVLRIAFQTRNRRWHNAAPISLDEEILNTVIRPRVFMDANLVGGQTILVSLDSLIPMYVDNFTVVFKIPPDRLMNRAIMSVLSVGFIPMGTSFNGGGSSLGSVSPNSMNDVMSAAQRVGDSVSSIPVVSNAQVELVGYNTIMIRDQLRITNTYMLRCVVANEENFHNINPRSFLNFARLCELAVKSFIYNTLIIGIDTAYLAGGQELGSIKTYIESLADSEEMYRTFLTEVWMSTNFMNSTIDYSRILRMQINPGL